MRKLAILFGMTLGVFLLGGCLGTDNPTSSGSNDLSDEEEIGEIIGQEMAGYFGSDVLIDEEEDGVAKTAEAIDTDRWRRRVEGRSVNLNIQFPGDGSAEVDWVAYVEGTLYLVDEVDSVTTTIYEKAFADTIKRYAVFRRRAVRDPWPPYRRWYLDSVSLGSIVSTPVNSVAIASVDVENLTGGGVQSFDDPSVLLDVPDEIPAFAAGDSIEVTIEAGSADLLAFLHTGTHRFEMTNNGDGTYTGFYTAPAIVGPHFAAVDLLTEDSIYDDAADYDSNAWSTHYRVE